MRQSKAGWLWSTVHSTAHRRSLIFSPEHIYFPCPVAMCRKVLYVVDGRDKHIARSNTQSEGALIMKDLKSLDLKKYDTSHEEMVAIICLQSFLHRLLRPSAKRRISEVVSKGPVTDALGRVQLGIRYTINAKKLINLIDEAVKDTISYMESCQCNDEYSMEIGEMEKVDAERVIACATADFNEFLGDAYNCLVE